MKRYISLFLLIVSLFSLSACNKKSANDYESSDSHIVDSSTIKGIRTARQDLLSCFEEYKPLLEELSEKLLHTAAKEGLYDIFVVPNDGCLYSFFAEGLWTADYKAYSELDILLSPFMENNPFIDEIFATSHDPDFDAKTCRFSHTVHNRDFTKSPCVIYLTYCEGERTKGDFFSAAAQYEKIEANWYLVTVNRNLCFDYVIMEDICITEIDRFNTEWNQMEFPIDLNEDVLKEIEPIGAIQTAVDIGTNIIEALHRNGRLSEYTLVSITRSIEDNVWRFEYSIDQRNVDTDNLIDCGCLYVAIDGNKGTLLNAWLEE